MILPISILNLYNFLFVYIIKQINPKLLKMHLDPISFLLIILIKINILEPKHIHSKIMLK